MNFYEVMSVRGSIIINIATIKNIKIERKKHNKGFGKHIASYKPHGESQHLPVVAVNYCAFTGDAC